MQEITLTLTLCYTLVCLNVRACPGPRLGGGRTLEETLCREVASVAAAFEIKSSRWNGRVGEGRAVFEVRYAAATYERDVYTHKIYVGV